MTVVLPHAWETRLLARALEGRAAEGQPAGSFAPPRGRVSAAALAAAYRHCEAVTRAHSRSFHLATALMPAAQRRAMRALYAVCRLTDDLVDAAPASAPAAGRLAVWRRALLAPAPPASDPVLTAWARVRWRYRIPRRYVEQLLDGVGRDLCPQGCATFDDLAAYCYGVASTVGLMAMHIIGFAGPEALPYAVRLGVALQLTNILRDVGEDWRHGRVYLPREEMAAFGLDEVDLAAGRVDDRWRAFLRFQIERNRRLYAEAWPGIGLLHPSGRFAVAAAAGLYRAILDEIEANDYDVFTRRAHLGALAKLARLPGLWWQARRLGPQRQPEPERQ
jgi:phytoene synthase